MFVGVDMRKFVIGLAAGAFAAALGFVAFLETAAVADAAARGYRAAPSRSFSSGRSFSGRSMSRSTVRSTRSFSRTRSVTSHRMTSRSVSRGVSRGTSRTMSHRALSRNLGNRNLGARHLGNRNLGARHLGARNLGHVNRAHFAPKGTRLIGMPHRAFHNPARLGGRLGQHFAHRPAIVFRHGHFWRRSWYYGLVGGILTWYWWDAPVLVTDPEVVALTDVPDCLETDDCPMVPIASVQPRIITTPAIGAQPAAMTAAADPCQVSTDPATSMVSCTAAQAAAPSGACHLLYDYNDGGGAQDFGVSPPAEMPAAPANEYTNSCVWMAN